MRGADAWAVPVFVLVLTLPSCASDNGPFVCQVGQPDTVTFTNLGTFTADTVEAGGLTVTGSSTVNVLNLNGLGVVGGIFDNTIDGTTEYLKFVVGAGLVTDVGYHVTSAGTNNPDGSPLGEARVEAFDNSGGSLGSGAVSSIGWHDVSFLVDSVPMRSFTVTSNGVGDNHRISRVVFTPCQ